MQNRLNTRQDETSSVKYFRNYFEWVYETITYSWEFKKNKTKQKLCEMKEIKTPNNCDNDVKRNVCLLIM